MGNPHTESSRRYNLKAYDRVEFTVPKGQREVIIAAAAAAGMSTNAYIKQAIQERMERDRAQG